MQSLLKVQAAFVLSDPRQPDCPIVHASPEFLALTGYSKEEVEGRNCRFLQVGVLTGYLSGVSVVRHLQQVFGRTQQKMFSSSGRKQEIQQTQRMLPLTSCLKCMALSRGYVRVWWWLWLLSCRAQTQTLLRWQGCGRP
jgi:PAS domain-containing protein